MKTACTTDIRMAIVEALECRVAGTAHELATDTGLDAGLVVQLLIEAAVVTSLSAWRSLPAFVRRGYALESKRMAHRAAAALAELLEVASDRRPTSNTLRRGAAGQPCDERFEP